MSSRDDDRHQRDALIGSIVDALIDRFGDRAADVVRRQIGASAGEATRSWEDILAALAQRQARSKP
jgi:hypothetical protein